VSDDLMVGSRYGVGLIGCGKIGEKRAAALPDSCELRAVYDVRKDAADSLAAKSSASVCASQIEVFERDDVNLVIIATTHDQLTPLSVSALEHGKHVFVEKPGGRSPAELTRIRSAAQDAERCVAVGFNHRFHPAIREAKSIIQSGKYGPLLWLRGRYGHGGRVGYEHEWRASREASGGGELMDQGCHLIDLTTHLCGTATLDHARLTTSFWPMDVEDNAFLSLALANGATAWLHVSWTEWKNLFSLEITLQRAKLEVQGLGGSYGTEVLTLHEMKPEMGPPVTTRTEFNQPDNSWQLELQDFIARIEGRPTSGADLHSSLAVHELIADAYAR
jgi:predicted dehydrogenase